MNEQKRIFIMLILCGVLLLVVGIGIGYLMDYNGKKCLSNPFIYGISEINELNEENFNCFCSSENNKMFSFNEDQFINGMSGLEG